MASPDNNPAYIGLLLFLSVSDLFQTILSNAKLDRSNLDEKGHKVVKSPTSIAGRDQLNLAKFGSIHMSIVPDSVTTQTGNFLFTKHR